MSPLLENVNVALVAPFGIVPDAPRFLTSKPSMFRSAGVLPGTDVPSRSFELLKKFDPGESPLASCVVFSLV